MHNSETYKIDKYSIVNIVVIVPVYNEAENLRVLTERLSRVFNSMESVRWKCLFVDDGSQDASWEVIKALSEEDCRVHGLTLSRNFGKEIALTAGVETSQEADAVICIDADLQHPPELIPDFIREWKNGYEVVIGVHGDVEDYTLIKKIGSALFYRIVDKCCDIDLTTRGTDFRLLDQKVVKTLSQFSERTRMFRGLIDWMGFRMKTIEFRAPARLNQAKPSYSYKKLFGLAINSITSFSLLPLKLTGYLGVLVTMLSGLLLLVMLTTQIMKWQVYTVQAYFVVFITFLVGIMLCALGLMALYIGHIHTEVVGRPLYIVREKTFVRSSD
jgi:dolichol-phosphate mannosyltransferase